MKLLPLSLLLALAILSGCTKDEPFTIKGYSIGLPIKDCPSNNTTINKWTSDGITHCLLQRTTYAGFESSTYQIEIFNGLLHAVKLEVSPEQDTTIENVMTSKYGNPDVTNPYILEWHKGSQVLFLFTGTMSTQIRLVDRDNQRKHQESLNSNRAKDL